MNFGAQVYVYAYSEYISLLRLKRPLFMCAFDLDHVALTFSWHHFCCLFTNLLCAYLYEIRFLIVLVLPVLKVSPTFWLLT